MTFAVNIAQGGSNNTTMRNRIINGAMMIDQRNAGAAVTGISSGTTFITDRFCLAELTDAVFTAQQDTSAPSGFVNSLKITTTTADASIGAGQYAFIAQRIEGTNTADFGWGASGASTVTLSFWVRSSLTGTFSGSLSNSAFNYSYAFEYSISAANTWEQKTITIAGATAGTWLTTNGIGLQVIWSLGQGSNFDGTVNTWASAGDIGTSGSVAVASTLNATWQITGVQLEKGSTATSFEYRLFGTEFNLCLRYFEQSGPYGTVPTNGANTTSLSSDARSLFPIVIWGSAAGNPVLRYMVPKRATPTITPYGNSNGYLVYLSTGTSAPGSTSSYSSSSLLILSSIDANQLSCNNQLTVNPVWGVGGAWTASAEL